MRNIFKNKIIRILLIVICFLVLLFGIFREKYAAYSLKDDKAETKNGFDFIEAATTDSLMLKNGRLYNTQSLLPEGLSIRLSYMTIVTFSSCGAGAFINAEVRTMNAEL